MIGSRDRTVIVTGNFYDKYNTLNPISAHLVKNFLQAFDRCVSATGANRVTEVGCGEGELAFRLARAGIVTRAFDISPKLIAEANARRNGEPVVFTIDDAYSYDPVEYSADLVVCCEVLEHLQDPELAMARLSRTAPRVLLSVPREPIWRILNIARLKYLKSLGNTPGHIQHWTGRGFVRLVQRYFQIELVESPFPWTMVLGRVRNGLSAVTTGVRK